MHYVNLKLNIIFNSNVFNESLAILLFNYTINSVQCFLYENKLGVKECVPAFAT